MGAIVFEFGRKAPQNVRECTLELRLRHSSLD